MDLNQLRQEIRKDPILSELSRLAKEKKTPFFLVGGYLRDLLLGAPAKDYDFALPRDASSFIETIEEAFRDGMHNPSFLGRFPHGVCFSGIQR